MMHSYPFYVGDWRQSEAATAMTSEQRGIYRELLDQCWMEGSLPADEVVLRRFARAEIPEWKRSWPVVRREFFESDGRLHHKKVDEKRPKVLAAAEGRQKAADKTNQKRYAKNATSNTVAQRDGERDGERLGGSKIMSDGQASPSSSSSTTTYTEQPPTPPIGGDVVIPESGRFPEVEERWPVPKQGAFLRKIGWQGIRKATPEQLDTIRRLRGGCLDESHSLDSLYWIEGRLAWFDEFWEMYPRKVAKQEALVAWWGKVKDLDTYDAIIAAMDRQGPELAKREPSKIPHASTWINGQRWEDKPESEQTGEPWSLGLLTRR